VHGDNSLRNNEQWKPEDKLHVGGDIFEKILTARPLADISYQREHGERHPSEPDENQTARG
jgi:hypothetical protein